MPITLISLTILSFIIAAIYHERFIKSLESTSELDTDEEGLMTWLYGMVTGLLGFTTLILWNIPFLSIFNIPTPL